MTSNGLGFCWCLANRLGVLCRNAACSSRGGLLPALTCCPIASKKGGLRLPNDWNCLRTFRPLKCCKERLGSLSASDQCCRWPLLLRVDTSDYQWHLAFPSRQRLQPNFGFRRSSEQTKIEWNSYREICDRSVMEISAQRLLANRSSIAYGHARKMDTVAAATSRQ